MRELMDAVCLCLLNPKSPSYLPPELAMYAVTPALVAIFVSVMVPLLHRREPEAGFGWLRAAGMLAFLSLGVSAWLGVRVVSTMRQDLVDYADSTGELAAFYIRIAAWFQLSILALVSSLFAIWRCEKWMKTLHVRPPHWHDALTDIDSRTIATWGTLISGCMMMWQIAAYITGNVPEHVEPFVILLAGSEESIPLAYAWAVRLALLTVVCFAASLMVLWALRYFRKAQRLA